MPRMIMMMTGNEYDDDCIRHLPFPPVITMTTIITTAIAIAIAIATNKPMIDSPC